MIQTIESFVSQLAGWMWGAPLLILLFGTHIFLTFQLKGIQFRTLPLAFKIVFSKSDQDGDISHFSTLMTALAATVGIGNIVGVATAITLGGAWCYFLDVADSAFWYVKQNTQRLYWLLSIVKKVLMG